MPAGTPLMHQTALNADVVGYSRHLADDFEATSAAMSNLRIIVEQGVAEHGGTVANFVADSFMAVFDRPEAGVRAAIAIATALEELNADLPASKCLRFRMGMDLGAVNITEGTHFEGDALNIAARIQTLARPGGLSVSGRVYRALDEPALRFRSTGTHRLRNIPEAVEIYEFVSLPTTGAAGAARSSLSLELPTLAVLPIHTEEVDDGVRSAAEIIRGDLVHRLASIPELKVIETGKSPGSGAPARYMLETGVHQFGDTLRVFATLFDVVTMNVVKSHKVTASVSEALSISDRLADEVARAIEVELIVGAPAGLYAELNDPASIEKVYVGWYHLRSGTREGWSQAVRLFDEVAEAHPDMPYGFVLSAFANWTAAANGWTPAETLDLARQQAEAGAERGDPTGMAQAVTAAILMSMGRIEESMEALDQMEIIRPTCDVTYALEGSLRRYMGQWEQAVDLLDVAMRLTGINKPWYPTVKACSLFIGNRVEQAAAVAEEVLEYQPHNLEALLVLTAAQIELGLDRRARATVDRISELFPSVDVSSWLDRTPYQDATIVDRWKDDLKAAGVSIPA